MKKSARFLAGILAGCMILGQTVFAEEAVSEDQTPAETAETVSEETEEQAQAEETEQQEEELAEDSEQLAEESERQTEKSAAQESDAEKSIVIEEEKTPAAESIDAADAQSVEVEKTVYVGIPVRMEQICDEVPWYYTAESSDPAICEVTDIRERQDYSGNGYSRFNLIGKKPGSVDITFTDEYDYSVKFIYHVEVKAAPSDAVPFGDAALNGRLLADGRYDQNNDGYISVEEMKGQEYFDLSPYSGAYYEEEFITDLSGMEYAEDAATIYLSGNETLENIDVLAGLSKLRNISLDNTAVSDAAKWAFADFADMECEKGDKISVPKIRGLFGEDYAAVKLEILENPGDNVISVAQGSNYGYPYFCALNPGTAKICVSWGEFAKEITIAVTGNDVNQELDAKYGVQVQLITQDIGDESGTLALKENGELWMIDPEMKVIGRDIKKVTYKYVLTTAGKVYSILDMDNVLMENVKDISGNAILTGDGVLLEADEAGRLVQKASDVKEIVDERAYLKNNGELYSWEMDSVIRENVEYLVRDGYYVTGEGFYQIMLEAFMGDVRAVKVAYSFSRTVDGIYTMYDLLVTEDGDVWATDTNVYSGEEVKSIVKLGSDFGGFYNAKDQWDWCDTKGNCYKWKQIVTPTESNPIQIVEEGEYSLMRFGNDADDHLYKNGTEILNNVKQISSVYNDKMFALRIDGSIWDVTETPKKLGTLNTGDDIVKGDVTGDGEVKIDDLRLVLRSVCKKVTLTSAQKQAADVEQNGAVNIADLRLILRFVCGKVESL